jgi:uncharacterized membrane protein
MTTILLIIVFVIGVYIGWKYEHVVNDIIETIKIHLNIK